jgi:hypothetical protein
VIRIEGERFQLAIPIAQAIAFSMGWSDLEDTEPNDVRRRLIGVLAIDALEYTEQWRAAGLLRACLKSKWPDCFPDN